MNVLLEQDGLDELDQLGCEALVLPLFEDERPPRGTLGLVDWRFAGRISRLVERDVVRGGWGAESVLPARMRLPSIDKLFVVGMGPRSGFDDARFERGVEAMLDLAAAVKLRTLGVSLPGRGLGLVEPVWAIEGFLRIIEARADERAEITILDEARALRAMEPVLTMARRRMRARHSAP